jgi:hypothetical protein
LQWEDLGSILPWGVFDRGVSGQKWEVFSIKFFGKEIFWFAAVIIDFLGVDLRQPFQSRENETASPDLRRFDPPG